MDASNFSSDLTLTRVTEQLFLPELVTQTALTEIQFIGDTASNLDCELIDSELFVSHIGTGDSRLIVTVPSSAATGEILALGSGQFSSEFGFVESLGIFSVFDAVMLRNAGGIDTDNGISLGVAVPEPSSAGLLMLTGVTVLIRRRKPI